MKKFLEILVIILLSPFILIGLIDFFLESFIEMLIVKHTVYFKKNKLTIKEDYYVGILNDPVFKIKNMICKYELEYEVIEIEEYKTYIVVNKNDECKLIIINMKNQIVVIIEHAGDNLSAYVEEIDGIAVIGNSIDEVKTSMIEAIEEYKTACVDYNLDLPEVLAEDYNLIFELDVCSF